MQKTDLRAELRNAAKKGNVETVVKILAQSDVNAEVLNAQDNEGRTALILAAFGGNVEIVQAILNHEKCDADTIKGQDNRGCTALIRAAKNGYWAAVLGYREAQISYLEIVQAILNHEKCDADALKAKDKEGQTALMSAIDGGSLEKDKERGLSEIVEAIRLKHEKFDTDPMWTSLRNEEIVKVILKECDADTINAQDNEGRTAQMIASAVGDEEINRLISAHRLSTSPWNALQRSSLFSNVSENRVGITLGAAVCALVVACTVSLRMYSLQANTMPHTHY